MYVFPWATELLKFVTNACFKFSKTFAAMPLFVPTVEPTAGGLELHWPVSAASISAFSVDGVGVPEPLMLTHAAVFDESAWPLLVMNLIVLPQPLDV